MAEREWTTGMLGSEGGVFSALDLECLERNLGKEVSNGGGRYGS